MAHLFRTTRRIEFVDTDMAGIVHFSNFFRFMESAEVEYLRSLGLSVSMPYEAQHLAFPRVAASCDYMKPAYFEDLLDVEVRVKNVGRSSVTYAFEFSKAGAVLARGQVTSVCCRTRGDRQLESAPIPDSLRAKLMGEVMERG